MKMRINFIIFLKDLKIYNNKYIILYDTSFHNLLNNFFILIYISLYILRGPKLMFKHIFF